MNPQEPTPGSQPDFHHPVPGFPAPGPAGPPPAPGPVPPGYAPAGYPPPGFPPASPKKGGKAKFVIGGVVALFLIICLASVLSGGNDKAGGSTGATAAAATTVSTGSGRTATTKAETTKAATKPAASIPKIGTPARDGKFEFTVTALDCGKSSVGESFAKEKAQGEFCLVTVKVKNIGKEAQTFDGSSQKAYAGGTEYSDSTAAEISANSGSTTFLEQINPGNQVTGKLVYDVPKGTKLTSLELHDSMFSGGVKISLTR